MMLICGKETILSLFIMTVCCVFFAVAMQQDRPRYVIDRPAYNLQDFDTEFDKKSRQFPVGEKVKKCFRYRITCCIVNTAPYLLITQFSASDKLCAVIKQ